MHEEIENAEGTEVLGEDVLARQGTILEQCRQWVEDLGKGRTMEPETEEEPDLYSFYQELCVLRNEFRKNARRSHEVFSGFGESLDGFQATIDLLTRRLDLLSSEQDSTEILARQRLFLHMVELHERLRRFGDRLGEAMAQAQPGPAAGSSRLGLLERIKAGFRPREKNHSGEDFSHGIVEGFSLMLSHFDELLSREGISRIVSVGSPFDPMLMMAVGTEGTDAFEPDTVCEEIESGYLYGGHVLKLAKVVVAIRESIGRDRSQGER